MFEWSEFVEAFNGVPVGLVVLAFMVLVAPIGIGLCIRFRRNPTVEFVTLDDVSIEERAYLVGAAEELGDLDFELLGFCRCDDFVTNAIVRFGLFRHRTGPDMAMASLISNLATGDALVMSEPLFEFARHWSDGDDEVVLCTGDNSEVGIFHPPEGEAWARVPDVTSVEELYELHSALASECCPQLSTSDPLTNTYKNDVCEFVSRKVLKCDRHVQSGVLTPSADGEHLRLTVRGSYTCTWKCVPPFKQIRMMLVTWRGRRLQRRLAAGQQISRSEFALVGRRFPLA